MSKKVLITGVAGFIGSNLAARCTAEGWSVRGVDDMSNGHKEFVPSNVDLDESCFSHNAILRDVGKKSFDVVYHLAAVPRVSYSVKYPLETNDVNVTRTLKLVNECANSGTRLVFASSSSVYGGADDLPTPTDYPKQPKSPYALQKSIMEDYMTLFGDLYNLDSVALRFFNVFGPNQLGDSPYATAVSAWLNNIMRDKPMRSDGDGTQTRDMCYVDNVTEACVLAAMKPGPLKGERFNVACGDRTSNNEILQHFQKLFPQATKIDAPWRPGDVMHTQADISETERVLGYTPKVTFWPGLAKTIEWWEDNWYWIKSLDLNT